MGVDRTLFIDNSWDVENIMDVLNSLPELSNLKYHPTHSPDYTILIFDYQPANEKLENRSLNFHRGTQHGGFTGNLLTLGAWGSADVILKTIADRVGGFYQHQDCDDNVVRYDYKAAGNLDFMLRHAVLRGKSDGRDLEEFVKDHNEVSASWKQTSSILLPVNRVKSKKSAK